MATHSDFRPKHPAHEPEHGTETPLDRLTSSPSNDDIFLPPIDPLLPLDAAIPIDPPEPIVPTPPVGGPVSQEGIDMPEYRLVSAEFELPEEEVVAGRYDLVERIARGGMGSIYRGRDRLLNRTVAVKVLRSKYLDRPDLLRRFMDEAQISAKLQHPGVVPVYEVGTLNDGRPYIAMKLIEGMTLAKLLAERSNPKENLGHFLKVFESLCQTISYAHSQGVIHRDLKPDNVMVGAFGEVLVMDWGIAKSLEEKLPKMAWGPVEVSDFISFDGTGPTEGSATVPADCRPPSINEIVIKEKDTSGLTNHGQVFGTMRYMPPEQARGDRAKVDRRCDVFALGGILCEILTGQPPYIGTTEQVRDQSCAGNLAGAYQRLDRSGADASLVMLAKHCLAINPNDRPNDAAALADLLSEFLEGMQARNRAMEIERFAAQTQLQQAEIIARQAHRANLRSRMIAVLSAFAGVLLAIVGLWLGLGKSNRIGAPVVVTTTAAPSLDDAITHLEERLGQTTNKRGQLAAWHSASFALEAANQRLSDTLQAQPETTTEQRERVASLQKMASTEIDAARLTWELEQQPTILFQATDGRYTADDVAKRYARLMARYALDVPSASPSAVAAFVNEHPSASRLTTLLTDWLTLTADATEQRHLAAILREVTTLNRPNQEWLSALSPRDPQALAALVTRQTDVTLPPASVVAVARWLNDAGFQTASEQLLVQGVRRFPADFSINAELGRRWQSSPEKRSVAIRHLAAAVAAQPSFIPARMNLAKTLADAGQVDEGLDILRETRRLAPKDASIPYFVGLLLEGRSNRAGALEAYTEAIHADPTYAPAQVRVGQFALEANKFDEAEKAFRAALAFAAEDRTARVGLAQILLTKGETEQGLALLDKLTPKANDIRAQSLPSLLRALRQANRFTDAKKLARSYGHQALTPELQHEFGLLALHDNDVDAIGHLKAAVDANPKSPTLMADYAKALAQFGRFRAGMSAYRQASELLPPNDPARDDYAAQARTLSRYAGLETHVSRISTEDLQSLSATSLAELGEVCWRTQRYAHAAKFFALAAKTEPRHAEAAARAAVYAGWGLGIDTNSTTHSDRAFLRQQALAWFKQSPTRIPPADRLFAFFASPYVLAMIPAKEQQEWLSLWNSGR